MIYDFCQKRHFLQFLQFRKSNALFIVSNKAKMVVESRWVREGEIFYNKQEKRGIGML